jgi:GxxExxY protein
MLAEAPFNNVTHEIIAAAIEVHRVLGPGLLESAYFTCLKYELSARKLPFVAERRFPVVYKDIALDCEYRLDLLVDDVVVVEVKSLAALLPIHQAQLLTYLRLTGLPVGLLINFNVDRLVNGVKRVINPRSKDVKTAAVRLPP